MAFEHTTPNLVFKVFFSSNLVFFFFIKSPLGKQKQTSNEKKNQTLKFIKQQTKNNYLMTISNQVKIKLIFIETKL